MENTENNKQSKTVWYGLRICFWTIVAIWIIGILLPENTPDLLLGIYGLLLNGGVISTFVFSLVSLVKNKKKAFAIVSLVISSIMLLLIGFYLILAIIESGV